MVLKIFFKLLRKFFEVLRKFFEVLRKFFKVLRKFFEVLTFFNYKVTFFTVIKLTSWHTWIYWHASLLVFATWVQVQLVYNLFLSLFICAHLVCSFRFYTSARVRRIKPAIQTKVSSLFLPSIKCTPMSLH